MGLVDDIKNQVKKSGSNKGKILYLKPGVKVRVRFLTDMDKGMKILFHDSYTLGINVPCQELFDRECEHCDNDELRHRDLYLWSVWDYEAKEVKLLMGAVNNCSPIPSLVAMYDTYGTLIDRDYVITKNGQGTNATFSVVPMDKVRFRNDKAKALSESKILSIIDKAFPDESESEDDEDEDERPRKKPAKRSTKKSRRDEDEDDEEDEEEEIPAKKKSISKKKSAARDEEDEDEELEYDEMSPFQLYKLCIERGIKAKKKMDEEYYIELLEENDDNGDDEDDEEEDW